MATAELPMVQMPPIRSGYCTAHSNERIPPNDGPHERTYLFIPIASVNATSAATMSRIVNDGNLEP